MAMIITITAGIVGSERPRYDVYLVELFLHYSLFLQNIPNTLLRIKHTHGSNLDANSLHSENLMLTTCHCKAKQDSTAMTLLPNKC